MKNRRFKKGKFYLTWREPVNTLTGLPTGNIPANKRTATNNHFSEAVYIPKRTRVMFVQKARHNQVRVLYKETLVQLNECFLIDDPESQE